MEIEVVRNKNEVIPTRMVIRVDGVDVIYNPLPDKFGYNFCMPSIKDEKKAIEIAEGIASVMENQSYDHGAQWRRTSVEVVPQQERYKIGTIVRVLFRVRDAG
jgi:hypothetical protein